jgi:hypothetical protein
MSFPRPREKRVSLGSLLLVFWVYFISYCFMLRIEDRLPDSTDLLREWRTETKKSYKDSVSVRMTFPSFWKTIRLCFTTTERILTGFTDPSTTDSLLHLFLLDSKEYFAQFLPLHFTSITVMVLLYLHFYYTSVLTTDTIVVKEQYNGNPRFPSLESRGIHEESPWKRNPRHEGILLTSIYFTSRDEHVLLRKGFLCIFEKPL